MKTKNYKISSNAKAAFASLIIHGRLTRTQLTNVILDLPINRPYDKQHRGYYSVWFSYQLHKKRMVSVRKGRNTFYYLTQLGYQYAKEMISK